MKLSAFLENNATRDLHAEGYTLPLDDNQSLVIYGPDSDVAREVSADKYRLNPSDKDIDFPLEVKRLYARLVKSWTFDEPITVELVIELFTEYPFIYDKVVQAATDRSNFTRPKLEPSASSGSSK